MSEEFISTERVSLGNRGVVYFGPCPWDDCVRATTKGRQVLHQGEVKTVLGIEAYAMMLEPRRGAPIGLLFSS